jgi:hypothetical protein
MRAIKAIGTCKECKHSEESRQGLICKKDMIKLIMKNNCFCPDNYKGISEVKIPSGFGCVFWEAKDEGLDD